MFGHMTKTGSFFFMVVGLYLFSAFPAVAQRLEMDIMSAADFAEKGDATGQRYAATLRQTEAKNDITCGKDDNICTAEQVCLRCRYSTVSSGMGSTSSSVRDKGRCINKDSFDVNVENYSIYWADDECPSKSSAVRGVTKGVINVEPDGFLSDEVFVVNSTVLHVAHEFTGKDGKKYNLVMSGKPTIVYGSNGNEGKAFRGCEVLPVKIYNHQKCFFCPLAAVIFGAANEITILSFNVFAHPFAVLTVVVFGIWLTLLALGQVFPMTKQDAPKFLSTILKQGFKVALVFLLLGHGNDLFKNFIVPVLNSGIQMGTEIKSVDLPPAKNWKPTDVGTAQIYFNIKLSKDKIEVNEEKLDDTLYLRIEQFLASVQSQLSYLQSIGNTLFCVGSRTLFADGIDLDNFKSGLRMMFLGGVLTAFGFLLTISFAIYFLDAILQLAVIGAMLPLMIAGWPYKATAQYAGTGFKMLLNTFFVMFFTGFVISVNIILIDKSIGLSSGDISTLSQKEIRELQSGINDADLADNRAYQNEGRSGLSAITDAMNNQNLSELKEATDIGTVGFMLLAFSCIFGFKFVSQVSPLAGTLSAGGFKGGLAGKIGTMGASFAKGALEKTTAPIRSGFNQATGGMRGIAARGGGKLTSLLVRGAGWSLGKVGAKKFGEKVSNFGEGINKFGKRIRDLHKQEAADKAAKRWRY